MCRDVLPLLVVAVIGLTACGPDSSTPAETPGPATSKQVTASAGTPAAGTPHEGAARAGAVAAPPKEEAPPERIRASQIRFGFVGARDYDGKTAKERAHEAADQTLLELHAGADFAGLAEERSDDASREHGGDLGTFARDEIHPRIAEAVFKLAVGKITDIIETEYGFHILKRTQ
ncbi:MAG: peptidylprolyl isomerase [Planctomycetota bacterium]